MSVFCASVVHLSTAPFRMITWVNISGFSPNLVCALILWRSSFGLLMGKFHQILTELSASDTIMWGIIVLHFYFLAHLKLCSGWAIVITFCPSFVHPSINSLKRQLLQSHWNDLSLIRYECCLGMWILKYPKLWWSAFLFGCCDNWKVP